MQRMERSLLRSIQRDCLNNIKQVEQSIENLIASKEDRDLNFLKNFEALIIEREELNQQWRELEKDISDCTITKE